jgi:hypothetical protein
MKKILLLLLLNLLLGHSWGQTWTKTQLSNGVSVDFPSTPEAQEVGNKKVYQVVDSNYIINVVTADMGKYPNFDVKSKELNNFYKGVIKGGLDAVSDSKLLNEKTITFGKYEGREIKYTKDFIGVDDILVTSRMVLIDKDFFIFEIWDLSKIGQRKISKRFFKSIRLK